MMTSRVENEKALQRAENRLNVALKMGNAGAWGYNIDNEEIWATAEGARIYGFPPVDGALSIEVVESCIPERERVHQALIDLINEEHEYNLEFTINPIDGSPSKVLRSTARLEKDEQGNPLEVFGFVQDITETKKTEQALQKEVAFSTSLINTAQLIIMVIDVEGRIQQINSFMEAITGYKEAEVKGKDWFDTFLPSADNTKIREMFKKAIVDIDVSGGINPIVAKDGRELMIEWHSKSLKNVSGTIVGLLSFGVDVGERIQAEEARKESASIHNSILRAAPIGIGLTQDRIIKWTNENLLLMLGYSNDELLNSSARVLYDSEEEYLRVGQEKYQEILRANLTQISGRLENTLSQLKSPQLDPSVSQINCTEWIEQVEICFFPKRL